MSEARSYADVLVSGGCSAEVRRQVLGALPASERHLWFGSMKSSQALAQSVFANLTALGKLDLLGHVQGEDGSPVFFERAPDPHDVRLEHLVDHLGEPRRTSVDAFVGGPHPVAIECKLAETEVGTCSRPRLRPSDPGFERDHCDGSHSFQRGRRARCSLTAVGVRYWEYVPELFQWPTAISSRARCAPPTSSCATCWPPASTPAVASTRTAATPCWSTTRNPAFAPGGGADLAWQAARAGLHDRRRLRRCSWQRLIDALEGDPALEWLVRDLDAKYGLRGNA